MERFESLINSLKNSYENGSDKAHLLNLLDQMRHELASTTVVSDHTNTPVSVWLPVGYHLPSVANVHETSNPNLKVGVETIVESLLQSTPFSEEEVPVSVNKEIEEFKSVEINAPKEAIVEMIIGVPKPPMQIIEEHEENNRENEEIKSPVSLEEPIFNGEKIIENTEEIPTTANNGFEDETTLPQVFELTLDDSESEPFPLQKESTISIPPGFLVGDVSPAVMVTKPKELHEILANRVVAKEEPVKIQSRILADSLSATKIQDLKKGIGINDRFRFIKSLFRGDESLFDRSIKTINNFNILPEAEYWIQRELVIKLGWNEDDELVQEFYNLVNRRFL